MGLDGNFTCAHGLECRYPKGQQHWVTEKEINASIEESILEEEQAAAALNKSSHEKKGQRKYKGKHSPSMASEDSGEDLGPRLESESASSWEKAKVLKAAQQAWRLKAARRHSEHNKKAASSWHRREAAGGGCSRLDGESSWELAPQGRSWGSAQRQQLGEGAAGWTAESGWRRVQQARQPQDEAGGFTAPRADRGSAVSPNQEA